jgi:NADH-quinone oxidoreductase subunit F
MVDRELTPQLPEVRQNERNAKRKIAIVGAGPAGLSCAYFLARMGYRPKVFEARQEAGGMLVQAIPAYRLPREALSREINMIEKLGLDVALGVQIGKDFTLSELRDAGYESVFLAVGAPFGIPLAIPGSDAEDGGAGGVVDALTFLRDFNLGGSASVGKRVAVIGGGNVAVDAARTAMRLGAERVSVVYRRTREEMPAYHEEVEEAIKEGVEIIFLAAPVEIVKKKGRASVLKCQRMSLGEYDQSGRQRPVQIPGEILNLEVDQIIVAIGQNLKPEELFNGLQVKLTRNNYIDVNPVSMQTSAEWLFAGGDAVSGPASVVEAVGDGEKAAVGIDTYLNGESGAFWRVDKIVDTFFDPDADPVEYSRTEMHMVPVNKRTRNFMEIEMPWQEDVALREAKRCLRCDYREDE